MKICKVVGNVWATKKDARLEGIKLMVVMSLYDAEGKSFVAADYVGAGIGEKVLVVTGSTARYASGKEAPIEASIVGIVDQVDLAVEEKENFVEVGK